MTRVTHPKMVTHFTHDPLTNFCLCLRALVTSNHVVVGQTKQIADRTVNDCPLTSGTGRPQIYIGRSPGSVHLAYICTKLNRFCS